MPFSRRRFLTTVGTSGAAAAATPGALLAAIAARGREAATTRGNLTTAASQEFIRLDSNENPHGPAADAIDAVMRMFSQAARYPDAHEDALRTAIAGAHHVPVDAVLLGCGSTEILQFVTDALTSRSRRLLTAAPTFETPRDVAVRNGVPMDVIAVDGSQRIDLQAMYERCRGAGLLFICNPNNPTGTFHGVGDLRHFISQVHARSPESHVLVDEAYFEYADDPTYGTLIPDAVRHRHLIVSRTFSKIFGLAGMRVGYAIAHPETIRQLQPWRIPSGVNVFAAAAALSSLELPEHVARQKALNREARTFAVEAMAALGYRVVPSQANFFLTDIQRDPREFREAMRQRGVTIGRPFPPLASYARISVGTLEEMQRAMSVASEVLRRR